MTHRKALRDAARAALQTALPDFTEMPVAQLAVNTSKLPAWAMGTPREVSAAASKEDLDRQVTLMVVVKREGDDLEDLLDEDAATIEEAVIPALLPVCRHAELSETLTDQTRDGGRPVGQIVLRISCWVSTETPI